MGDKESEGGWEIMSVENLKTRKEGNEGETGLKKKILEQVNSF